MKRLSPALLILAGFVVAKVLLHLMTADTLGFHRDEFLYLALGRHLDWGYWSNPPFIGAVSWFSQTFLGDSVPATRALSALAGGALVLLTGLMVRDLGGRRYAQVVCGTAMLLSIAWLRAFSMLQPVPFDILCWAFLSFATIRWIKTGQPRWYLLLGAGVGLGFLIKYTMVFWLAAFLPALLLTPRRRIIRTKTQVQAGLLAFAILLPNLLWQWYYQFPVVTHMKELAQSQLENVKPVSFLVDQLLMQGPGGVLVWLAGLLFLLLAAPMRPYRLLGIFYLMVLLIFLALNGKSYYTLGAYPVLMAAGAVFWERFLRNFWLRSVFIAVIALPNALLFPIGVPIWPAEKLAHYSQKLNAAGTEVTRWEDGKLHALPQDYADMLGWPELAALVQTAIDTAEDDHYVIFGENYGQAGAVSHLCKTDIRQRTYSFSDSYRLWAPEHMPPGTNTLIYINDELGEDVQALFSNIQQIGAITNPLAREHGTGVWLCRQPRTDLDAFWAEQVRQVRTKYHISGR